MRLSSYKGIMSKILDGQKRTKQYYTKNCVYHIFWHIKHRVCAISERIVRIYRS